MNIFVLLCQILVKSPVFIDSIIFTFISNNSSFFVILALGNKNSNLFKMGIFGVCSRIGCGGGGGGGHKVSLPKICHTYPTIMKPDTVIPYLKKIQKIYESRDTAL